MARTMLSLATNPYNPFDDYVLWLRFDHREGFDTAGLLARLVPDLDGTTVVEEETQIEAAIDSVVANPAFGGLYIKVTAP